jgi:amidohydrolase
VQEDLKGRVEAEIQGHRQALVDLSHRIHAHPELAFEERQAHGWLMEALERAGLEVEDGPAGLPTAFRARKAGGALRVAVCAEYDALPGVGHACGHNIIAAAAAGAAIGLAPIVDELGVDLLVVGTPAEENGGGKIRLLDAGAFDGVHAAIMVHPGPLDLLEPTVIGVDWIEVTYEGKASHASASPELGINAADAVAIAHVAIGLLRQHISQSSRVHGIITAAGDAPNIIPARSEATYMVRATTTDELALLRSRVEDCFRAGALATGARLEIAPARAAYAPMRHDTRLTRLYRRNAEAMGRRFADTDEAGRRWAASTDMGNVSQVIPSAQPMIGIESLPATNHQPEFAAASVRAPADQAVIDAAIAMAQTIVDMGLDSELRTDLIEAGRPVGERPERADAIDSERSNG